MLANTRPCGQPLQSYFYANIHAQVPELAADGKTGNGRGRQAGGGQQGSRNQFSNNKGVNGVSYFK